MTATRNRRWCALAVSATVAIAAAATTAAADVASAAALPGSPSVPASQTLPAAHGAVEVLSLSPSCDAACAGGVRARLEALGATDVRVFGSLRMVSARVPSQVVAGHAGGVSARRKGAGAVAASARDAATADLDDLAAIQGVEAWAPDGEVHGGAPLPLPNPLMSNLSRPYLWGKDRINQPRLPLDRRTSTARCYPAAGAGVHVFVLDTGCNPSHEQFSHLGDRLTIRAAPGSAFTSGVDNGRHGTHVAATIAGAITGVAPRVNLTCIKVLKADNTGSSLDVLAALDAVVTWADAHPAVPAVLSASFGGRRVAGGPDMLAAAAARVAAAGVVFVASAGNEGDDACAYTPAVEPSVVTVANAAVDDTLAGTSNRGACVTLIAPGTRIVSADAASADGRGLVAMTGTSMAAPHVSGLAALVLGEVGRRLPLARLLPALNGGGATAAGLPLAWVDPTACDWDALRGNGTAAVEAGGGGGGEAGLATGSDGAGGIL